MVRCSTLFALAIALGAATAQAQRRSVAPATDPWALLLLPNHHAATPTTAAITAADLKTRLFIFADDSMMGRELGSRGNVRSVEYIARELKRSGLLPAGTDGTYFQNVPVELRAFDTTATISVGGVKLVPWVDYYPRDPGSSLHPVDGAQVIYAGDWLDSTATLAPDAARGKVVLLTYSGNVPGNPPHIPGRIGVAARYRGAAAIAIVGLDDIPAPTQAAYRAESPVAQRRDDRVAPIYLYVTHQAAARLLGAPLDSARVGTTGGTVTGAFRYATAPAFTNPTRNVIALLPGSDPALRGEYVVVGAHNDHIGTVSSGLSDMTRPAAHDSIYVIDHLFRPGGADDPPPVLSATQQRQVNDILTAIRRRSGGRSARIDSIFNGADDDGSGSMSALEIAQYLASRPVKPRRSILFVWHVGEEEGRFGSIWFTDHPTVSRDSIVAEINMDMVGRGSAGDRTGRDINGSALHGGPGYLEVIGSRRLSSAFGNLVESVNSGGRHGLRLDYAMDANHHPQNQYCRSDQYEYARYGIPIVFFTTGDHADNHQLTDEAQYIDYASMVRVDDFIADFVQHVANLDHRPAVDQPKPDPLAECVQ